MPISCRVARNGHKRQTPHPPLSQSPFPSRGRLISPMPHNKKTVTQSSHRLFCLVLFAHDAVFVPHAEIRAAIATRGQIALVLVHIKIHGALVGVGFLVVVEIIALFTADILHINSPYRRKRIPWRCRSDGVFPQCRCGRYTRR